MVPNPTSFAIQGDEMTDSYNVYIKDFLADRLDGMMTNPGIPWVKPTEDPILNGYNRPYEGLNRLLLTHYCRKNKIPQRIFCNFQQRRKFGFPVWKNEKSVAVMGKNGNIYSVFPCPTIKDKQREYLVSVKEYDKELNVKVRSWADKQKKYPFNDDGICSAIYNSIFSNMPWKNDVDKLYTEITAACIANQIGISKKLEAENIQRLQQFKIIADNMDVNEMVKVVNREMNNLLGIIKGIKLDPEIYQKNISSSLLQLQEKNNEPKKFKLEELLTPRIKR